MSELVVPGWAWGLLAGLMVLFIAIDLLAHRGDKVDSRGRAGFKSHAFSFHSAIQGGVWRNSASVSLTGTNRESETSLDSYRFLDHRYLYGSGLFQSRQLQHSFPSPCRHVSIGIPAAVPADFLSGTAVANQPGTRLSFAYGQNFGD